MVDVYDEPPLERLLPLLVSTLATSRAAAVALRHCWHRRQMARWSHLKVAKLPLLLAQSNPCRSAVAVRSVQLPEGSCVLDTDAPVLLAHILHTGAGHGLSGVQRGQQAQPGCSANAACGAGAVWLVLYRRAPAGRSQASGALCCCTAN